MDKKISELTVVQSIDPADVSILVHDNNDYQFTFDTLLNYISSNIITGAAINFGATLPQNNTGKNGDIFINTNNGNFAQKRNDSWIIVYTLSPGAPADGTLLYGLGTPGNLTGKNGDSYIDTGNGSFYKKATDTWALTFTMLNGPAGVKGDKGDTGAAGNNGKSILNGSVNPSNQTTGTDGDFYINTSTWSLFGPKTGGIWTTGLSLLQDILPEPLVLHLPPGTPYPFSIAYNTIQQFGANPTTLFKMAVSGGYRFINDCYCEMIYSAGIPTSLNIYGHTEDNETTIDDLILIIKP